MSGITERVPAIASGAMNTLGQMAPSVTGAIIGFGVGGPPGAIAGFALGAGLAERVFPRIENRAAKAADNAEQEVLNGIRRVVDASVGVISHYGNLWAPIYLGYVGMGGFETVAHRSYDWYESHCEKGDHSFGNHFHCNSTLVFGGMAYAMAGAALLHTGWLLHGVLAGKTPLFQEKKNEYPLNNESI